MAGAGKVKHMTKTVVPHSHEPTHVLFTEIMFTAQRIVSTYKSVNMLSVNCPLLMFQLVPTIFREDTLHDIKEKDTLTAYEMQTMLGKVKKSIKTDLKGLRQ